MHSSIKTKKLIPILIFLLTIFVLSCKKSSTAPQVDDLTRSVIWISVSDLSFTLAESGDSSSSQILQIKNTGATPLSYTLAEEADWLTVSPSDGESQGENDICEHTVTVRRSGLEAREDAYEASISVISPQSYNNPQEVKVLMQITEEPPAEIEVEPTSLTFNAQQGGLNPGPQTIVIRNSGDGKLKYEIEKDKSWINVTPDSGQSSGNPRTHTVIVETGGMNTGTHHATLTIRDPEASNNPQTVDVTVNVSKEPLPEIWVSSNRLNFKAPAGTSTLSQPLEIANSGGGTLKYNISTDAPILTVNPSSGSSSGQAKTHSVTVNCGGLPPGTYNGNITIADPSATNSPYNVNVKLELTTTNTDNRIWISSNPNSASKDTIIDIRVGISGNLNEIQVFGLDLYFDTNMFQYHSCERGNLTGGWAAVSGNEISAGVIRCGGFAGAAPPIPIGSEGTIAVIKLRVTGDSYPNGQQSQLEATNYTDQIVGMTPDPARTTFTLQK
jgi:hypothetical protein